MTLAISYTTSDELDKQFEDEITDQFQDTLKKVEKLLRENMNFDLAHSINFLRTSLSEAKVNQILDSYEYFCDFYDEGLQD